MTTTLRFVSPDGKSMLKVLKTQGRRGINVRASLKTESDTKAQTGCRSTHATDAEAEKAVETLREATLQRGWIAQQAKAVRNAFGEIPHASTAKTRKS